MIKLEHIEVTGFRTAVRGMRNPMNSWSKSDTVYTGDFNGWWSLDCVLGECDLDLMRRLYKGGTEHRKYLRQINVSMDITAPLYWWKEFDTYKVGTVANSCSTMHKIHSEEITMGDFSTDHLNCDSIHLLGGLIAVLNKYREAYIQTKKKEYWWQIIQLLPSSYNQKRTITMNYENVMNVINQRENHKLREWREFVETLRNLPYVNAIRGDRG